MHVDACGPQRTDQIVLCKYEKIDSLSNNEKPKLLKLIGEGWPGLIQSFFRYMLKEIGLIELFPPYLPKTENHVSA